MTLNWAEQRLPLRRLTCARCSMAFDCGGAAGGCWCMDEDYRLPMPDPAGGDCLCPACLRVAVTAAKERTA
jgi:hypothetical protein